MTKSLFLLILTTSLISLSASAKDKKKKKLDPGKSNPEQSKCNSQKDSFACFKAGKALLKKGKKSDANNYFEKACKIANDHIWAEDIAGGEKSDIYSDCYNTSIKKQDTREMELNFTRVKKGIKLREECLNPIFFASDTLPPNLYYKQKGEDVCIHQKQISKDKYKICMVGGFEKFGRARNAYEYFHFIEAYTKYTCKKYDKDNKLVVKTKAELLKATDRAPSEKVAKAFKNSKASKQFEVTNFRSRCDSLQSANDCLLYAEAVKDNPRYKYEDDVKKLHKKYKLKACAYGKKSACEK